MIQKSVRIISKNMNVIINKEKGKKEHKKAKQSRKVFNEC